MNVVVNTRPAIPAADEMTLESALADCGWEQQASASWWLPTEHGECVLVEIAHRDRWRQFQLSGGATPQPDGSRVLENNSRLFGPAKLIARPGHCAICRLDVPEALTGFHEHAMGTDGHLQIVDAADAWATAVTVCATGKCDSAQNSTESDESVAGDLKQTGWSASLDNGQLQVHLQLPGAYRLLEVERDTLAGVKLGTELVNLTGLDDDCVRAIKHVANEVNTRLPLVRLTISGSTQNGVLRAEVGFGARLIPGTFLLSSLHAFETAAALCVRELEALRDPELARLVLTAAATRESHV